METWTGVFFMSKHHKFEVKLTIIVNEHLNDNRDVVPLAEKIERLPILLYKIGLLIIKYVGAKSYEKLS